MVIMALEMEQQRREKERESLRQRLASVENRLCAIRIEKEKLLDRVTSGRDIEHRREEQMERKTPGAIPQTPLHPRGQLVGGIKFQY
jgi:regulator of replication initiation timing